MSKKKKSQANDKSKISKVKGNANKSKGKKISQSKKPPSPKIDANPNRHAISLHKRKLKSMPLRERLKEQLKASRFRYFNEQFYVSSSSDARKYFTEHPDEFEAYHEGYEQQVVTWPVNPVDEIIKELQRRPKLSKPEVIADFGCGKAKIAQTLQDKNFKFFSFDLVAANKYVTACDMANTHLFNNSVDIAVFCLSLMGSNITDFIKEASRVIKDGGLLKLAEVKSRFDKVDEFIKDIEKFGFSLLKKNLNDPAFYYFDFKKKSVLSKNQKKKLPVIKLKPCLYKQR